MSKFNVLLLASWAAKLAAAKDVYLDWNVTWVNAAPDGFERPVIGINGQWPCPQIDVDLGDRLIVDVYNGLGNQSTGIHWHGFHQYHTAVMDGSSSVTQCPLPPGEHMQYHFDINQTGTYWYHSHNMGQYPDGFRGPLIVHDPNPPFHYDEEFTLTLSDWSHGQMADLINQYESRQNQAAFGGREPLPDAALINDSTNTKIKVEPGKTYLVHVICLGNWPGHTWVLDGHEMTVVEVDGVYTKPRPAGDQMLRIATGQRVGVLIHTKNDSSQNFAIWDTMDVNMMFVYEDRAIPKGYNPNATAWLVYDETKPLPPPPTFNEFNFVDDVSLVPADKEPLLQPVDHQIILDTFSTEINGIKRFTVNNKTYLPQDVPTLYTANTIGHELSSNPEVYGQVNPFVVKHGEVVEIVINNHHNNLHPWHLHGHQFQVLQRSAVDGGYFTGQYYQNVSQTPMRRDTIMVQNHGHVVIRFRADNPGVWLLHCHVEWHVEAGLMATIIEAPETFPRSQKAPPKSHYNACAAYPDPTNGNAAGKHGLDLAGANTKVPTENHGATYVHKNDTAVPPACSPSPSPSSSRPLAPKPSTKQSSSLAPTHTPSPSPQKSPVPKPTHHHSPPPAPVPSHHQAPPPPQPPTQQAPGPKPHGHQPAPEPPEPVTEPVHAEPAPTYYYLMPPVPPGHDEPIFVHSDEVKGPWPNPHQDSAYVKQGGHLIHTHDNGDHNLPEGYQYWEAYERHPSH